MIDITNTNSLFPKKIGIVFLENIENKKKSKPHLNFDQEAASYIIVQMNSIQSLFNFNIVDMFAGNNNLIPEGKSMEELFNEKISQYENQSENDLIDYWILVTSEEFEDNWFFKTEFEPETKRIVSIITDSDWEELHSPPSLFEYLVVTVLTCSLYSLSYSYGGGLTSHQNETRGCVFDFTKWKSHRRILVANPQVCEMCKQKIIQMEKNMENENKIKMNLVDNIQKLISHDWMGDLETRNSPIFNLKKNYGFDVDANSGFYKKPWEKIRDSIEENTATWIVGGLVTVVLTLLGTFLSNTFMPNSNIILGTR